MLCPEEKDAIQSIFATAKQHLESARQKQCQIQTLLEVVARQTGSASDAQKCEFRLLMRDVAASYEACLVGMKLGKIRIESVISRMKKHKIARTSLALVILVAAGAVSGGVAYVVEGVVFAVGLSVVAVGCGGAAVHQIKVGIDQWAKFVKLEDKLHDSLMLMAPDLVELRRKLKNAATFMEICSVSCELPESAAAWNMVIDRNR